MTVLKEKPIKNSNRLMALCVFFFLPVCVPAARADADPMRTSQTLASEKFNTQFVPSLLAPHKEILEDVDLALRRVDFAMTWLKKAPNVETKLMHLQSLQRYRVFAAQQTPHLEAYLRDDDKAVRHAAAVTITFLRPDHKRAFELLSKALDDDEPWYVGSAAVAMTHIGKNAAPAIPALIKLVKRRHPETVGPVAISLARVAPGNRQAMDVLIELAEGPHPPFRAAGVQALSEMGESAVATIPVIERVLFLPGDKEFAKGNSQDLGVMIGGARGSAAFALGKLGQFAPKRVFPSLLKVAGDSESSPDVRRAALYALNQVGPISEDAIAPLVACLRETRLRQDAGLLLGKYELGAVDPLMQFAMNPKEDPLARRHALILVARVAETHPAALLQLKRAERDGDVFARDQARHLLRRLELGKKP